MSGSVGYDPNRIVDLRNQTLWAIGALRAISSSDPAAGNALGAVAGMHRVLDDHWMPAITEIQRRDPLARPGEVAGPVLGSPYAQRPRPTPPPLTKFAGLSNIDLIYEIQRAQDVTLTSGGRMADLDHVYWTSDYQDLVSEIEQRWENDLDFQTLLPEYLDALPILGMASIRPTFPPDLIALLLRILVSYGIDRDHRYPGHLDLGVNGSLDALLDHPQVVLDLLLDEQFALRLLGAQHLDRGLVAAFIRTGLIDAIDEKPSRLSDAYEVIEHSITAANTRDIDRGGFAPPVAQALATALASLGPTLLGGLDPLSDSVRAQTNGDEFAELATAADFRDLLGALVRDPVALVILLGFAHRSARDALDAGARVSLSSVSSLSLMIDEAARNEDLELELDAAARAAFIGRVFEVFDVGLLDLSGVSADVAQAAHQALERWAIAGVDASTIGVTGTHRYVTAVIRVEVLRRFLADPANSGVVDVNGHRLDDARRRLRDLDATIADGAAIDRLEDDVLTLVSDVIDLGGGPYYTSTMQTADPYPTGRPAPVGDVD